MKVELIIAKDDHTWDTEVVNIPDDVTEGIAFTSPEWDSAVIAWCHDTLMAQSPYRAAVYVGIYNSEPDADADVPKLIIRQDTDPTSPRENEGNLGTMVCWHGKYTLGDVRPTERPEDWFKENFPPEDLDGGMCLPLYLLDHSGITMSTENFNDQWDSGQVGWIVAKPEKVKEAFGDNSDKSVQQARKNLIEEVRIYDQYLRGAAWGYEFGDDSCWGFFGDNLEETGMVMYIPEEAHDQVNDAWEKRHESS
jgi:hypothetical protein